MINRILERLGKERVNSNVPTDVDFWSYLRAVSKCEEIVQEVAKEYGNGWIPCSERLPEDNGLEHYEITFLSGINKTQFRSVAIFSKGRWYMPGTHCRDCDWFPFEVIAWKKPSAPYQKGE